jgi:Leucine-rich repeat (LRR) protein
MGRFSVPNLQWITINKLENLKSLPESMHTLFPSLTSLIIKYCPQLELFSDGGLPSSLEYLCVIGCSKLLIASLKWAWGIHTSLEELHIEKVDVESFPDQGLHPLSLKSLHISSCPNLKNLDYKGLCHLSGLEALCISNCPSLQCLPMEGLPKSISTLDISDCPLLTERCKKPNGEDWEKISHIESVEIDGVMIT